MFILKAKMDNFIAYPYVAVSCGVTVAKTAIAT